MAVSALPPSNRMVQTDRPVQGHRPVRLRHFVRLKARVLRNGVRGSTMRVLTFVFGVIATVYFGFAGMLLFAMPGLLDAAGGAEVVAGLGGTVLVLGWLFLPLVFFGVDESLDPARFALLPLSRRTLVGGLFAAALLGLPAFAVLFASAGLVIGAGALGGWPAATAAAVGALGGLLLCVAVSRAVTSAFATALRSRKTRDLAAIVLTALAALIGPLQLTLIGKVEAADWKQIQSVAYVLGWTPFGAPFTLGVDVATGRAWAVPLKLLITAVTIAALLRWWASSLENAMLGARGSAHPSASASGAPAAGPAGRPVDLLIPRPLRWLPRNRFGALVGRESRYWWREARRRASLLTFGVVGLFLPAVMSNGTTTPTMSAVAMVFVGLMGALNVANQFGFEGTAYATNMIAAVPGRTELHSRALGLTVYLLPAMIVIAVTLGLIRNPAWIPALLGAVIAAYGVGLALATTVSVVGAYAMPDTSNPFAISSGGGIAKSFFAVAILLAAGVLTVPFLLVLVFLGVWPALPIGLLYGGGAYFLGVRVAGALLDRRQPELLAAVNHRP